MELANIKKISILGAGTMGPGIAMSYALFGYEIGIWSKEPELFPSAQAVVKKSLETLADFGTISADQIPGAIARIHYCEDMNKALENTDYVIEAIIENVNAKRALYEELDKILPDDVIIASNTSILNIFELMPKRRQPNTIIAHWFAPPHVVPLVEVVKGEETSDQTVNATLGILKKIDKQPVLLKRYVPGFIINRLQMILGKEVYYLLDNGYVSAEDLDAAVKASLAPRMMVLGLVQRIDFTGLDMSARNLENKQYQQPPEDPRPASIFDRVARGELGVKSGKGFFDYSGMKKEDIMKIRDERLLKAFACSKGWGVIGK